MDPYQELTLYQRSAVLMAAAKLGAFAALGDRPSTAAEVAVRIGADADAVRRLLEALRHLEYVSYEADRYALNGFSSAFLRGGAGGMVRLAWKEHVFYEAWSRLAESIGAGAPQFPSYRERIERDFASVEKFLLALNDLAQMAAPGVLGTGAFEGLGTLLDLGGGAGGYAGVLASTLGRTRVTLADLPEILPIARVYLAHKGLEGRVELVTADFLSEGCGLAGRTFEGVFLSHILHDFEPAVASAIVARAARLVRPGGRLVILDVFAPEAGPRNPVEALFDLMMLVEVPRGRTHGVTDVTAWVEGAGLSVSTVHSLYFGSLLEARAE